VENHIVWMELTVSAPRPVLLAVASLVIEWGARGIVEGTGEVVAYFTPEVREEIEIRLRRFAMDLGDPIRWVWHADVGEVWRDAWKSHFHASRVSDRLGVCPS
jgi:hypothetical protein